MDSVDLPRNSAEQASQDYLSRIKHTAITSNASIRDESNYFRTMEMEAYCDHTAIRIMSMVPKINLISGNYDYFIRTVANRLVSNSIHDGQYIRDNDIRIAVKKELDKRMDSLFHLIFKSVKSRHPDLLYERLITEIKTNPYGFEISNYIDYLNIPMDDKLRTLLNRLLTLPIFNQEKLTLEEVWGGDNSNSRVILPLRELLFKFIKMGLNDISYNKMCEEYYRIIHEEVNETLDKLVELPLCDLESVEYLLFNFLRGKIRHYTLNNYNYVGKEGITYVKILKYLLDDNDDGKMDFKTKVIEDIKVILANDEYKYYPQNIAEFYRFFEMFPDQFKIFSNHFLNYIIGWVNILFMFTLLNYLFFYIKEMIMVTSEDFDVVSQTGNINITEIDSTETASEFHWRATFDIGKYHSIKLYGLNYYIEQFLTHVSDKNLDNLLYDVKIPYSKAPKIGIIYGKMRPGKTLSDYSEAITKVIKDIQAPIIPRLEDIYRDGHRYVDFSYYRGHYLECDILITDVLITHTHFIITADLYNWNKTVEDIIERFNDSNECKVYQIVRTFNVYTERGILTAFEIKIPENILDIDVKQLDYKIQQIALTFSHL